MTMLSPSILLLDQKQLRYSMTHLKSSIRNAATSNVNIITKGPMEQIYTMPLTFGETARAKGALEARSGIEAYTETMTNLRVHSTARKVPDMPEANNLDEMIRLV
jgi:hypothetical protein